MTKSTIHFVLTIAVITIPTTTLAEVLLEGPCAPDRLSVTAALQRIEWARRCALITNTGGPNSSFPSTRAFDTTTSDFAREYREIDPDHAYSGDSNDHDVNYYYGFCRYGSTPIFTVFQETSGPTAGFWKWSRPFQRPRPLYPTFETNPVIGSGIPLFPRPGLPDDCGLYQKDPTTGELSRWTGNFYVVGYCLAP
jgi:hypothetical protein